MKKVILFLVLSLSALAPETYAMKKQGQAKKAPKKVGFTQGVETIIPESQESVEAKQEYIMANESPDNTPETVLSPKEALAELIKKIEQKKTEKNLSDSDQRKLH